MKTILLILFAIILTSSATAQDEDSILEIRYETGVQYAGDVIQVGLPLAALVIAYNKQDKQGAKQIAYGFTVNTIATHILKRTIRKKRPDPSTAYNAFPSGHTSASFHAAMHIYKRYGKGIAYHKSDIDEFHELSKVTSILTNKICSDYQSLKQFTENASHEIQTPLAIIRNLVEHISNQDSLSKSVSNDLSKIDSAISHLTALNQSLLLLSKIENSQFDSTKTIDFGVYIEKEVANLAELYLMNDIFIDIRLLSPFVYPINPTLAKILIRNLTKNMINHSNSTDAKSIIIENTKIVFSNNGDRALESANQLFDRFHKQSDSRKSLSLGLALVKAICNQNNLDIKYTFIHGKHTFTLSKV